MKWQDQGIVLSARRHGESSWILSLLTYDHGRHVGMARVSKKDQILLQMGNLVQATWTARLPEHLGTWQLELISSPLARIMSDSLKLTALTSMIHLLDQVLAERHAYPHIYNSLDSFIKRFSSDCSQDLEIQTRWLSDYVRFELMLLEQLGYGLDLSTCASTGQRVDLAYVSPKSGRAVSQGAGLPYQDRLFRLPSFLMQEGENGQVCSFVDLINGLKMTGYFLSQNLFSEGSKTGLPESRFRLCEAVDQRYLLT